VKRRLSLLLLALIALGTAAFLWFRIDPRAREIRHIQERLQALAKDVSFQGQESLLQRLSYAQGVVKYFADPAEFDVVVNNQELLGIRTRAQLEEMAAAARAAVSGLKVEFLDIHVELETPPTDATAHLTARIQAAGDQDYTVQELRLRLVKDAGDWLVRRVEPLRTMEK
jgi:hypothetical protein